MRDLPQDSATARSLFSFLDVLCCGFGGILLIVFVLLSAAESHRPASEFIEATAGFPTDPPFILLATCEPGPSALPTLHLDFGSDANAAEQFERVTGEGHAFLIGSSPPGRETNIRLITRFAGEQPTSVSVDLTVIVGTHRIDRRILCSPSLAVTVWPVENDNDAGADQ